jgi:hypothetical protein
LGRIVAVMTIDEKVNWDAKAAFKTRLHVQMIADDLPATVQITDGAQHECVIAWPSMGYSKTYQGNSFRQDGILMVDLIGPAQMAPLL